METALLSLVGFSIAMYITPGPNNVMVAASAANHGIRPTVPHMFGIAVGFSVMQATMVYRGSPVEMRARLLGVLSVCIGTGPIGFVYLGFLADVLTPRVATVALGAQGMLALLLTRRYWMSVFLP